MSATTLRPAHGNENPRRWRRLLSLQPLLCTGVFAAGKLSLRFLGSLGAGRRDPRLSSSSAGNGRPRKRST